MKYIVKDIAPIFKGFDQIDMGISTGKVFNPGTIIEVVSTGSGGRGIVAAPYLFLENGEHISGYAAEPYTVESSNKYKPSANDSWRS